MKYLKHTEPPKEQYTGSCLPPTSRPQNCCHPGYVCPRGGEVLCSLAVPQKWVREVCLLQCKCRNSRAPFALRPLHEGLRSKWHSGGLRSWQREGNPFHSATITMKIRTQKAIFLKAGQRPSPHPLRGAGSRNVAGDRRQRHAPPAPWPCRLWDPGHPRPPPGCPGPASGRPGCGSLQPCSSGALGPGPGGILCHNTGGQART